MSNEYFASQEGQEKLGEFTQALRDAKSKGITVGLVVDLKRWPAEKLCHAIKNKNAITSLQAAKALNYDWAVIAGHLSDMHAGVFSVIHAFAGNVDVLAHAALLAKAKVDRISPGTLWVLLVDDEARERIGAVLTGSV